MRRIFWEINQKKQRVQDTVWATTGIAVDNTASIALARNARVSVRNKHIHIKHHHVRALLRAGTVTLFYVRSENTLADILTKIVSHPTLLRSFSLISMQSD